MQMNIYFESTAWTSFLRGLRQQESKGRMERGGVSFGSVTELTGAPSRAEEPPAHNP